MDSQFLFSGSRSSLTSWLTSISLSAAQLQQPRRRHLVLLLLAVQSGHGSRRSTCSVWSGVAFISINTVEVPRDENNTSMHEEFEKFPINYFLYCTVLKYVRVVYVPWMRHGRYLSASESLLCCCTPVSAAGPASDARPGFRAYKPPGRGGWTLGRPTGEDQSAKRRGKG